MPSGGEPLTPNQIKARVTGMDILRKPATADARTKAILYQGLGLNLTYHPDSDVVEVLARPQDVCATERVEGRFRP